MKYVQILTSRPAGQKCVEWARKNVPEGWELIEQTDSPNINADVIISVLYANLLKEDTINGKRVYNFHPGILPEYAGSATFPWAIMNGERSAGITLHKIVPEVDAGEIIEIREFALDHNETGDSLWKKATGTISWMFEDWFSELLKEDPKGEKQDRKNRRVYTRKELQDAKDLTCIVRAMTFKDKDPAYFIDANGIKRELKYD